MLINSLVHMTVLLSNLNDGDQPGKVANSARGQLNRGTDIFCPRSRLIFWSRETGSSVPPFVSLLISILGLNSVLTYGTPPEFRSGAHLFILPYLSPRDNSSALLG